MSFIHKPMPINVWGYLKEYEQEREEILACVDRVFRSGQLILGPEVKAFEQEFAGYCGAKHGVGVNSATDGLFLGLKALGIGTGDEVITVSNTAVPTVCAIESTGARAVFVDIDSDTYLMDTSRLEKAITPRTKCILPVHLFGQCADMDVVLAVARKHGLKVLEDCAQSHGAAYKGKRCGSLGDAAVFSFYPTKILGTFGDAGLITTDDDQIAARLRRLRFYGMESAYYSEESGYNSRLDEVHAAILRFKLKKIDAYIERRRSLAARYEKLLAGTALKLPSTADSNFHAYYLYVVRHPDRDKIMEDLRRSEINVGISYPWPIHTMRGYKHLGYKEGDLPRTEKAAKEIFSLPMYPSLSEDEQDKVCATLIAR